MLFAITCQFLMLFSISSNITKSGTIPTLTVGVANSMIWMTSNLTIGINLLVYKSIISSLLKWSQTIRNEPKLLNKNSLDFYWTAVDMGQKVVSDSIYLICTSFTLNSIAVLYRFFAYIYGQFSSLLFPYFPTPYKFLGIKSKRLHMRPKAFICQFLINPVLYRAVESKT